MKPSIFIPMYILSRYSFLFQKDEKSFIYNSRFNSFFELTDECYNLLNNPIPEENISRIEDLVEQKLIVLPHEDDDYVNNQHLLYNLRSYSCSSLDLTILPTISCNLRCPYCFETNKPFGLMDNDTINHLITFIKDHRGSDNCSITWFGGEPLLGVTVMKSILDNLSKANITIKNHSIISNGTLLGSQAIHLFNEFPLDSIQITLDGSKETHNKKRYDRNGMGTFNLIMDNVDRFSEIFPNTFISFRINIDKNNAIEYIDIYKYIQNRFKGRNIGIYAGILRANRGCESEQFFTSKDHLKFNKELQNHGIINNNYPNLCSKGCCATKISSYVIGPKGELYNCWEHVGQQDKIIGNVRLKCFNTSSLFENFILNGHCYQDKRCRKCGFLPICSGGCANKRIENLMDNRENDLCSIYYDNKSKALIELLYDYYVKSKCKSPK